MFTTESLHVPGAQASFSYFQRAADLVLLPGRVRRGGGIRGRGPRHPRRSHLLLQAPPTRWVPSQGERKPRKEARTINVIDWEPYMSARRWSRQERPDAHQAARRTFSKYILMPSAHPRIYFCRSLGQKGCQACLHNNARFVVSASSSNSPCPFVTASPFPVNTQNSKNRSGLSSSLGTGICTKPVQNAMRTRDLEASHSRRKTFLTVFAAIVLRIFNSVAG